MGHKPLIHHTSRILLGSSNDTGSISPAGVCKWEGQQRKGEAIIETAAAGGLIRSEPSQAVLERGGIGCPQEWPDGLQRLPAQCHGCGGDTRIEGRTAGGPQSALSL